MKLKLIGVFCILLFSVQGVPLQPDTLTPADLGDVTVGGAVGDLQRRFLRRRVFSDFARETVWAEARAAFERPDDDVFKKPAGMWKGEFWGKLMISAGRVAQYAKDPQLTAFLRDEALRLIACQRPDGYLGTYVNADWVTAPDTNATLRALHWPCDWNWNLWCRKYTLWGLVVAYRLTGDARILRAAERATDQEIALLHRQHLKIANTGTRAMRGLPPCSTLKPLLLLYEDTGKAAYLDFAKEIYASWSDPTCRAPQFAAKLASGKPLQDWYPDENGSWGKAYEMMSCLAGIVEYYRVTGDAGALALAKGMRERILADELNLCLSVGYNDQFWGAGRHLNGVSEPCDAIHWIRLNHELYRVTGEAKYADEIERCFYNAFLAGVRPDGAWGSRAIRSHGRHQPAPPQSGMRHQHCCVNNMPRGFMDAAQTILAKEEDGTLRVALYHDGTAALDGTVVTLAGNYPVAADVTVTFDRARAGRVKFRHPAWCPKLTVRGGGVSIDSTSPGWCVADVPAGRSEWRLSFDRQVRIVDSRRAGVSGYDRNDHRFRRWANNADGDLGERDLFPLLRTTPAAQITYGPLLLAKSVRLGSSEAEILDSETVNCGGARATLVPSPAADGVWGCWTLTLEKDGRRKVLPVCNYSSAAVWGHRGVEFSTFF